MFKSVIAASAALSMSAGAALAGPYVNVEANASYPDGEYSGATTDLHLGYEGGSGKVGYYVQGGPAFVHSEAADDTETELSGKVGVTYAATETLGVYGEIAGITAGEDSDGDEIIDWGAKVGVTYAATETLGVYGEIAGITAGEDGDGDEIIDWGAKVGVKFDF